MVLKLYSRPGCHLCEEMKAIIERVGRHTRFELIEVDVSTDPELERLYGREIPVLEIDGHEAARHRVTEAALHGMIAKRP